MPLTSSVLNYNREFCFDGKIAQARNNFEEELAAHYLSAAERMMQLQSWYSTKFWYSYRMPYTTFIMFLTCNQLQRKLIRFEASPVNLRQSMCSVCCSTFDPITHQRVKFLFLFVFQDRKRGYVYLLTQNGYSLISYSQNIGNLW